MKSEFKYGLIIASMLGYASPSAAAAIPCHDFDYAGFLYCFRSLEFNSSNCQSQADLIKHYERVLEQNPKDDQALEQLHMIVARADGLDRPESLRLRQVIRQYTHRAQTVLSPPNEPGEPMIVRGTVRDEANKPIAGALLHVFHADANGNYSPESAMDEPNARLFGYMKTGPEGTYEFRTIRPGGYALQPIPQHIHMLVTAAGYRDHACRSSCQVVFDDDERMTPKWRKWAKEGGNPILQVTRDQNGVQGCRYDIVLHKN